jgi:GMP synthase (glutamine-hydrolysing)
LLILENDPGDGPGYLGDALEHADVPASLVRVHAGDPVPELGSAAGVVILGGPMGAYESATHPWLDDEARLIREAVAHNAAVLGICLGAQLIAHALGGRAFQAERPEVAVARSRLTPAGERHPLAPFLTGPYLAFHQDTFDLPEDATLLASSEAYPHVFRCGSALGIQPHPEVSSDVAARWGERSRLPERAGVNYATVISEMERRVPPSRPAALFSAWIDLVLR